MRWLCLIALAALVVPVSGRAQSADDLPGRAGALGHDDQSVGLAEFVAALDERAYLIDLVRVGRRRPRQAHIVGAAGQTGVEGDRDR